MDSWYKRRLASGVLPDSRDAKWIVLRWHDCVKTLRYERRAPTAAKGTQIQATETSAISWPRSVGPCHSLVRRSWVQLPCFSFRCRMSVFKALKKAEKHCPPCCNNGLHVTLGIPGYRGLRYVDAKFVVLRCIRISR